MGAKLLARRPGVRLLLPLPTRGPPHDDAAGRASQGAPLAGFGCARLCARRVPGPSRGCVARRAGARARATIGARRLVGLSPERLAAHARLRTQLWPSTRQPVQKSAHGAPRPCLLPAVQDPKHWFGWFTAPSPVDACADPPLPSFHPDHAWIEVLRIATIAVSGSAAAVARFGEGGGHGCWSSR
jgi:hypothetical protein